MFNISLLDHPVISSRMFYPWPNSFPDPFYVEVRAGKLGCWYNRPFPDAPTMMLFHGNGETVADYIDSFAWSISGLGINLFLAEYRGYGMSIGQPTMTSILDDVTELVKACEVDPTRLVFFGRSLGSLFAVHAASLYPQAAGLVLESGIADPLERVLNWVEPRQMGVTEDELRVETERVLNQPAKLALFQGRTLVMHTRNDDIVPCEHGANLHEWANNPKKLVMFERGDHNNIMAVNSEAYFNELGLFFSQIM